MGSQFGNDQSGSGPSKKPKLDLGASADEGNLRSKFSKLLKCSACLQIASSNNGRENLKKVLQNGYKYPQNSSTLLFSIDFIHLNALNALKFPKIVKKIYDAPPPPVLQNGFHCRFNALSRFDEISLNKVSNNGYKYPQNSSTSFSINLIALSVNFNVRCHGRIAKRSSAFHVQHISHFDNDERPSALAKCSSVTSIKFRRSLQ